MATDCFGLYSVYMLQEVLLGTKCSYNLNSILDRVALLMTDPQPTLCTLGWFAMTEFCVLAYSLFSWSEKSATTFEAMMQFKSPPWTIVNDSLLDFILFGLGGIVNTARDEEDGQNEELLVGQSKLPGLCQQGSIRHQLWPIQTVSDCQDIYNVSKQLQAIKKAAYYQYTWRLSRQLN